MRGEAQKGLAICPKPYSCRVQGTEWQKASFVIQRLINCISYFLPNSKRPQTRSANLHACSIDAQARGCAHTYLVVVTCQLVYQLLVGRALCSSQAAQGWFPLVRKG